MTPLEPGTQVVYVPSHINYRKGKFGYPNGAQPGFISSRCEGDYVFVRYWLVEDGKPINELRTKANSEKTPVENLRFVNTVPQEWVSQALFTIQKEFAEWMKLKEQDS